MLSPVFQTNIRKALAQKLKDGIPGNEIEWERVEPYAIDDASRNKAAALGIVDQGQRFGFKSAVTDNTWRLAVEYFVRCNKDEEIQDKLDHAKATVYRTVMDDVTLNNLVIDITPVMEESVSYRAERNGEGVMLFDIRYRTSVTDIAVGL